MRVHYKTMGETKPTNQPVKQQQTPEGLHVLP